MFRVSTYMSAAVLATVLIQAQSRPDFSGIWLLDRDQTAKRMAALAPPAAQPSGAAGQLVARGGSMSATGHPPELVISQTGTRVEIQRDTPTGKFRVLYNTGGIESLNVNGRFTLKTRSRWDGPVLMTEGVQTYTSDSGVITASFKETRSLASDGTMIVETLRGGQGGGPARSVEVYRRKSSR